MRELAIYHQLLIFWLGLSAVVFFLLLFVSAPYGRHARRGWGPTLPGKITWMLMEAPASIGFALFFFCSGRSPSLVALIFLLMWEAHYVDRAFIFPLKQRGPSRPIFLVIAVLALVFNLGNTYLNGRWLGALAPVYQVSWLYDPRFIVGVMLFVGGYLVNRAADRTLLRLRSGGQTGYQVPMGRLYRFVSCPNYLGELVEWLGWAIATWSWAGLTFFIWSAANLVPRAISHHRWYRQEFPDYPKERKALIPFIF